MITRRALAVVAGVIAAASLALAAAFVTGAAAQVGSVTTTSGSASFSDPAGDADGSPDITTVTLSDDPASGIVQLTVTANSLLAIDPAKAPDIDVFIDADKNSATGSPSGSEYDVYYWRGSTGWGWDVERWDGAKWQEVPQSASMSFSRSGDTLTWQLGKADLGGSSGFNFHVVSAIYDANDNIVARDDAPDVGTWSYQLSSVPLPSTTTTPAAAVKPLIGTPTTTPKKAIAGKRFTVVFPVTRGDNGAPLTSGKMICDPSVAGKVIQHAESFRGGTARLAFTIPSNAKGKLLKVKVTIKFGGKSTTKIATFRVG